MSDADTRLDGLVGRLSAELIRVPEERLDEAVSDALAQVRALSPDADGPTARERSYAEPLLIGLLKRHREEERLRKAAAEYRTLVENSPYCIHQIDTEGRLTSMNPAGLAMMGAERECDVRGLPYLEAVCEADRPRIAELLARAYRGEFSEFEFVASNGRRFQSNFVPIFDKRGHVEKLMGLTLDVTSRTELQRQLLQAQKMESIGHLTGGIAHDFNNILGAIIGYADLAQRTPTVQRDSRLEACLEEIRKAGLRGRDLVQHMLTFARKNAGKPQRVAADSAVEDALDLLGPMIPTSIRLERRLHAEPRYIEISPVQLEQAVMNLCINARDALEGKGEIALELRDRTVRHRICDSCGRVASGRFVEISVTDDGPGIDGDVARIFEPFYSEKEAGKGSGMGLAIVDGIVHSAGGHIAVETRPGVGTKFALWLPAADPPRATGKAAPHVPAYAFGERTLRGHVVIVDDEPALAALVESVLARAGLSTRSFSNSAAALEFLEREDVGVDLVVTDQTMPGLTGLELAERLRAMRPELPVVLSSGYTDPFDENDLHQRNVAAYLRKPASIDEILNCVCGLLESAAADNRSTHSAVAEPREDEK